uniref:Uncharacterized protein n=1 Tax=Arundo donax TaxID=35708 RepID=A0A0A9ASA3_ARUDO
MLTRKIRWKQCSHWPVSAIV